MEMRRLRLTAVIAGLCFFGVNAQAQVFQPSAVSARRMVANYQFDRTPHHDRFVELRFTEPVGSASSGPVGIKPIVIGVITGALVGAGAGYLIAAGACEGFHCSTRREVVVGASTGAVVGGLFGLVIGLPSRDP